jgi:hypothetical protein
VARGAVMTIEQCWRLALAWYPGRDREGWRRRNAEETNALFESVGLRGEFWRVG